MKWLAVSLLVVGLCLLGLAVEESSDSSFEDGTFLLQMIAGIVGGGMVIASGIIFSVELFLAL